MSGPNAAFALPPSDRDDAPIAPSSSAVVSDVVAEAGRKPSQPIEGAPAAQLTAIADTLNGALFAAIDLRAAFEAGDFKAADAARRRLSSALCVDLRVLSHQLGRSIMRAELERNVVEIPE